MERTTTLRKILDLDPFEEAVGKFIDSVGGKDKYGLDTPVKVSQILETSGFDAAFWIASTIDSHLTNVLYCDCADRINSLRQDPIIQAALDVARRLVNGHASEEEMRVAAEAAREAWESRESALKDAIVAAGDEWSAAEREWQEHRLVEIFG